MNARVSVDATPVAASETARTHRAAVLTAPLKTQLETTVLHEPNAREVRVRLEGCGVCASNLAVWEGRPWFEYPREAGSPGHEGWGVVDALGEGVEDLSLGDRVAMISAHAYAEYDIASREAIVRVPSELDGLAFPGEPLGCVMNIFERARIEAGQRVAIVGAGFLGVLLTQLAARAGAHVIVLSRRAYALGLARRMGAIETFATADLPQARAQAWAASDHRGYDCVIEAVGGQETLDLASALACEYGRLVIAGYHQDGPRQVDMQQWNWRALEVINAHERLTARYVSGVERAIAAVLAGELDPFALLTHTLPLGALNEAFELTRTRPDGFMKAIVHVGAHS